MLASVAQIHGNQKREIQESAPMLPTSDKETSLSILSNALTSSSGSNSTQKNEKASFGAIAEALRDEPAVRFAKYEVNQRSIPRIEISLSGKKRLKSFLRVMEIFFGIITVALGVFTTSAAEVETLKSKLEGGWAAGLHIINLVTGALLIYCAKTIGRLKEEIAQLERDLEKKLMYNGVAGRTLGLLKYQTPPPDNQIYKGVIYHHV
nr:NS3 [Big Cypress virus]